METFATTRPIFDRMTNVYGYDLMFRAGFESYFNAAVADALQADLQDAMTFSDIVGLARAHVVFPPSLLAKEVPVLFPPDTLIVGVPGMCASDAATLAACKRLKEVGYELALDDFGPEHLGSPFLEFGDIVQVDVSRVPQADQARICSDLPPRGIRTLARNVETTEAYQQALTAGYWYMQGDFFRRPAIQPGKEIAASKLNHLRLLNEVNKPELAYDELELLIKQDVSMTYRLLRFINSAWYGLKTAVESIRHALVLLGPEQVRVWASMLVLKDMGEDKPNELFRRCLMRGRMAEAFAPRVGLKSRSSELFLMGMFSLADALTDIPLARVLFGLPLSKEIKMALLGQGGQFGLVHEMVLAYEMGWWDSFSDAARRASIEERVAPGMFNEAREWADQALRAI
jgi:EAL and modified HD-GYP domain-containing signal transduction protein